jgi:Xaa-Pro aminopeptidase
MAGAGSRDRQIRGFDAAQLDRFRAAQRASYAVLEETAKRLEPGVSERETTTRMMRAFGALGVQELLPPAVALFGARTALPGAGATATSGRRRRGSPRATR